MELYRKKYFKKAFIISISIEAVLCSILLWASFSQGHSGYFIGMFLHIPGSFVGILIGEAIQKYSDSGVLAVTSSIIVAVILQFFLFLICIQYIFKKKHLWNLKKHDQTLNLDG